MENMVLWKLEAGNSWTDTTKKKIRYWISRFIPRIYLSCYISRECSVQQWLRLYRKSDRPLS
jgi:hypothetical protein